MAAPMESQDSDDFFYSSMKLYKTLHMFELQNPPQTLQPVDENCICVTTFDEFTRQSEILELSIPEKLLHDKEDGLCNDRDFKVISGGFHGDRITALCHIPDTRYILSNEQSSNTMILWRLGQETGDVINEDFTFRNPHPYRQRPSDIAVNHYKENEAVFGSRLADITIADLETQSISLAMSKEGYIQDQKLGGHGEPVEYISGLEFLSNSTIATCCLATGNIVVLDTRDKLKIKQTINSNISNKYWAFGVSRNCTITSGSHSNGNPGDANIIARIANNGKLLLNDLRYCSSDVDSFETGLNTEWGDLLNIKFKPGSLHTISLSGFDGNIYIYDMNQSNDRLNTQINKSAIPDRIKDTHPSGIAIRTDQSESKLELDQSDLSSDVTTDQLVLSLNATTDQSYSSTKVKSPRRLRSKFKHEGHWMCNEEDDCVKVLHQTWHSAHNDLVFSCGSDGSLHAWKPDFH
ncbi:unnamed protein product [Owenia fusiformis]|uniref:Uncharacterized protein n=1 Tax=Owenia fusiformis TaxID=6347 RepID=A0A8J1UVD1_OWEFU|nr:unnamed protein product [Owenia fusiformis]